MEWGRRWKEFVKMKKKKSNKWRQTFLHFCDLHQVSVLYVIIVLPQASNSYSSDSIETLSQNNHIELIFRF